MGDMALLTFNNTLNKKLPFLAQKVATTPFRNNVLVAFSPETASLLDMPEHIENKDEFLKVFSGQKLPKGGEYSAQVYAGHQFGQFVPQLGDGRSIAIGEVINQHQQSFEVQLKGSGPTPYSRMGDGRAVLRSCIREFLASEAMAALGIPTTRALCISATDDYVYRETPEQGAIMTRVTPSNIRFGHFEFFFHHNKLTELNALADYCLTELYPECLKADNPHLAMLTAITERTAKLIAHWQAVGFAHGVMNTDNMSILGLTIDYGPYGFLDAYHSAFICNHSDHSGRYAFDQQPSIGLWNLNALAYTFSHWLSADDIRQTLQSYEPVLIKTYNQLMMNKLGLSNWQENDRHLLGQLLAIMELNQADYSLTFRRLNTVKVDDTDNLTCQSLLALFNQPEQISAWLIQYRERLSQQTLNDNERIALQNQHNAKYILRNYLAEVAIRSANAGDYSEIERLRALLISPFDEQPQMNAYSERPPTWGTKLAISCSS